MISSCFFPMILLLFTANTLANGAVWNGNLDNYFCGKWSPLVEPFFSNTAPPVAITHIFCGQLRIYHGVNGVEVTSEGFHARPGNRNPRSAKIDTTSDQMTALGEPRQHCPYRVKAMYVKIRDAKRSKWVPRTCDPNRNFIFFPPSWSKSVLVQRIINVYTTCNVGQNNANCFRQFDQNNRLTQICMRNYDYPGCSNHNLAFKIFLSWQGNSYLVVTAFPDASCN